MSTDQAALTREAILAHAGPDSPLLRGDTLIKVRTGEGSDALVSLDHLRILVRGWALEVFDEALAQRLRSAPQPPEAQREPEL